MKSRGIGNRWMNSALCTAHTSWAGGGTSQGPWPPSQDSTATQRLPPLRKCFVNEISMQILFYYDYTTPAPRAGDI